jgi:hypothetical protein
VLPDQNAEKAAWSVHLGPDLVRTARLGPVVCPRLSAQLEKTFAL